MGVDIVQPTIILNVFFNVRYDSNCFKKEKIERKNVWNKLQQTENERISIEKNSGSMF